MKVQRAITIMENAKHLFHFSCSEIDQNIACDMALNALKKQMPRKPVKESLADRACPACDAYISFDALNDNIEDAPKFCKNCGQAFDWEV